MHCFVKDKERGTWIGEGEKEESETDRMTERGSVELGISHYTCTTDGWQRGIYENEWVKWGEKQGCRESEAGGKGQLERVNRNENVKMQRT